MRVVTKHAMAAVAIGLCTAAVVSAAHGESEIASQRGELRETCIEQGGVFRRMLVYNDKGVKWGETLSCSTGTGTISCRSGICRIGAPSGPDGVTMAPGDTTGTGRTKPFPAETHAFSAALSGLNANRGPTNSTSAATR